MPCCIPTIYVLDENKGPSRNFKKSMPTKTFTSQIHKNLSKIYWLGQYAYHSLCIFLYPTQIFHERLSFKCATIIFFVVVDHHKIKTFIPHSWLDPIHSYISNFAHFTYTLAQTLILAYSLRLCWDHPNS